MTRRPTVSVLSARAMTALLTVWCLGCSSYEPLLDAMLGLTPAMSCESGMRTEQRASSNAPSTPTFSPGAESTPDHAVDCGCGSCHSASPQSWSLVVVTPEPPRRHHVIQGDLASVTLALAAPPPKPLA